LVILFACQTCAKLIDSDASRYTVDILNKWKDQQKRWLNKMSKEGSNQVTFRNLLGGACTSSENRWLDYDTARTQLMGRGLATRMNHWTHASNFDIQYGNGLYFWGKGYWEIRSASGTGLSFCLFDFIDVLWKQVSRRNGW